MYFKSLNLRIKQITKHEQRIIKSASKRGIFQDSIGGWYNQVMSMVKRLKKEYAYDVTQYWDSNLNLLQKTKLEELEYEELALNMLALEEPELAEPALKLASKKKILINSAVKEIELDTENHPIKDLQILIQNQVQTKYENEDFMNYLKLELFCITEDNLQYLNNQLFSLTSNQVNITLEDLYAIQKIAFSLNKLDEKGITSKNFHTKSNSYKKFREKALDEFGIYLNRTAPFANPANLFSELDLKLSLSGLDKIQKKEFYIWCNLRKRVPNQSITGVKQQDIEDQNLVKDYYEMFHNEEVCKMTDSELISSKIYTDLLRKYNIKEIPKSVLNYQSDGYNIQDDMYVQLEIEAWKLDREKEIELDGIFLNNNFDNKLKKLLNDNNLPLLIRTIEKYKLYSYINPNNIYQFVKIK